ncbi:sensor histidine kinase [Vibrio sp. SCSIO 43137]|uniref:sensor histidine kinase n=1 Tax=Vibrio sp. SCSIO 43137 TaxID=3021011 RepID=UPI0023082535|nr:HAMP domain-containing sensor histidine kinase [Vibrio sp. SCSIO 43137]WCE31854.1 HAMP domain-containing sensor histidine kinase [Vibrio sp. SCSIO 43137]
MKWLKDPFRSFLSVYGVLVLISISLLLLTRQSLNFWFLEKSALPLLEAQATLIDQQWYDEGPYATREYLREEKSSLFTYQFAETISDDELPTQYRDEYEEEHRNEEHSEFQFEALSLSIEWSEEAESADDASASIDVYLPTGERWQRLNIAINVNHFNDQFSSFNLLIYSVIAVLLLGVLIAYLMVRKIQFRLVDINQTSQSIRQSGDLNQSIPSENLSGPLAETIDEINLMLADIRHSVEMTKQQANNIAHDLRTPLTTVYNRVQQLSQTHPELEELVALLGRLLSTFNLLLRINRLESNGETPKLSSFDINPLFDDVCDLYMPALEDKNQQLTSQVNSGLTVHANADLLFQVICNLIDNAGKFSPEESQMVLSAIQSDKQIQIEIIDQSGGVSSEELEQLCDKFYRSDSSRHKNGNGLGLSFVRAAVERMGGTLLLENRQLDGKEGLSIQIRLPAGIPEI